jgi:hypothetical protein
MPPAAPLRLYARPAQAAEYQKNHFRCNGAFGGFAQTLFARLYCPWWYRAMAPEGDPAPGPIKRHPDSFSAEVFQPIRVISR